MRETTSKRLIARLLTLCLLLVGLIVAADSTPSGRTAAYNEACPPAGPIHMECFSAGGRFDFNECTCNMACSPSSPTPGDCTMQGLQFDSYTCSCSGINQCYDQEAISNCTAVQGWSWNYLLCSCQPNN